MKRISAATERKLLAAIDSTAELINDGMTPNDAIVKVADMHGVTKSEIPLVVHAYNTGRTNRQRETADDILLKTATFELADTDTILERLYPSTVKTAAAKYTATAVSSDYDAAPTALVAAKSRMEKQARVSSFLQKQASLADHQTLNGEKIPDATTMPYAEGQQFLKDMIQLRAKQADTEELRRQTSEMVDKVSDAMQKLADYFTLPTSTPYAVVKAAAAVLYGDNWSQLTDTFEVLHPHVPKLSRNQTDVEKRASVLDCTQQPFPLIQAVFAQAAKLSQVKAAYADGVAAYEKAAKSVKRPLEPAISGSIFEDSSILDEPIEKKADGMIGSPVKMMGAYSIMRGALAPMINKVRGPDDSSKVNRLLTQLNDPSHEQRLRMINTHGLLTDLMNNDEVISGYPSDQVADAFSEISQISPSVSDQRGIMQALLRKRLAQGALDTFEQGQLLDFEQKLRQQAAPLSGGSISA